MSGLIVIFAAFIFVAVLDILSQAYGVDSRSDWDDVRAPSRGLI